MKDGLLQPFNDNILWVIHDFILLKEKSYRNYQGKNKDNQIWLGNDTMAGFLNWMNGKASGQDRTSSRSGMCQHSWKVITVSRSKTSSADQRHLAHYPCTAERWRHSFQTVHSTVTLCEIMNSSWLSSLGQFQARLPVLFVFFRTRSTKHC